MCEKMIMNSLFPHCGKAETVISGQKHTQDSLQVATFYVTKAGKCLKESSWHKSTIPCTVYRAYFSFKKYSILIL